MMKKESMENLNKLLTGNSSFFGRGKMMNIEMAPKEDTGEIYYRFELLCLNNASDDPYNQSKNTFVCVVPAEIAKNFSQEEMKTYKENEILVIGDITSRVWRDKKPDGTYKKANNNVSIYVNNMMLVREIYKVDYSNRKIVNL